MSCTFVIFPVYSCINRSPTPACGLFSVDRKYLCPVPLSSFFSTVVSTGPQCMHVACLLLTRSTCVLYLCHVFFSTGPQRLHVACLPLTGSTCGALYLCHVSCLHLGPQHLHVACLPLTGSTCGALYLCHVSCLHLGPQPTPVACLPLTGSTSGRWVAMMKACRSGVEKTTSCRSRYAASC